MKTDRPLQQDAIAALPRAGSFSASDIGRLMKKGVVTLTPSENAFGWPAKDRVRNAASGSLQPRALRAVRAGIWRILLAPAVLFVPGIGIAEMTDPITSMMASALDGSVWPPSTLPAPGALEERRIGKFVSAELATPDLQSSEKFYGGLFGWTFHELMDGATRYAEASINGGAVARIALRQIRYGQYRQPAWVSFIAVADVAETQKLALSQGAHALASSKNADGQTRSAVLADPQGAVFGIRRASDDDQPEQLPALGEWIWHTLLTTSHDAANSFYQTVFDYDVFPVAQMETTKAAVLQTILASNGYARASATGMPANWTSTPPHWLAYIRVADAAEASRRAVSLGGRILLQARQDRHGGKLAIVADPQGTPLGLMEWPDPLEIEVPQ